MIRWSKVIILAAILAVIVGILSPASSYIRENANLGLDLAGGVYVLLQAEDQEDEGTGDDVVERAMTVIRNRVDELGVSEPVIQREGHDRIRIELAGEDLDREEAMEVIGRTAQLEFYGPEILEDPDFDVDLSRAAAEKDPEERETVSDEVLERYDPLLTGNELADASVAYNPQGQPFVGIEFTAEGRDKFAEATTAYVGQPIVMILDNEIISAPEVNEPITGGEASIENVGDVDEAGNIALMLRTGALPVTLTELETRTVGPTLGADLIDNSVTAAIVAIVLVLLFMIVMYRLPGIMSCFALCLYLIILFMALISLDATFTLPGIAGLVLSIGMAVDANVIIFERIKEELRDKKTIRTSVDSGFKKALSTILDSNITTLIGAAILFYFGTGPVRGFAITLSVGIVASMFTAIIFSRIVLRTLIQTRLIKSTKYFGV